MKIAICDDEQYWVKEIENNLINIFSEENIQTDFDVYTDSEELCFSDKFYDMAFLDVEMDTYSGIEVAQNLKAKNPYIVIFIVTSYDKYLDDAMDLNVFRYIKKPLDKKRLKSGIQKALESIDNNVISFFLKNGKASINILSDDIIFVETVGRNTRVVTVKGEYTSENKMDFWKSKLIASFFYPVHKSFIINMKHITNYQRDTVTLSERYDIPVAYRKQAPFRSYFLKFFGGR